MRGALARRASWRSVLGGSYVRHDARGASLLQLLAIALPAASLIRNEQKNSAFFCV